MLLCVGKVINCIGFTLICQLLFLGKDLLVGFSEQDMPLPFLGIESRLGQSV